MFYVLLFVIVTFIIWLETDDVIDALLVGGLVFFMISPIVNYVVSGIATKEKYIAMESSICGLSNSSSSSIKGSFLLGTGSIKTEPYYFFFKETDYGKVFTQMKAGDVAIKEHDGPPKLVILRERFKSNTIRWLFFAPDMGVTDEAVLCVPQGTIVELYEVD